MRQKGLHAFIDLEQDKDLANQARKHPLAEQSINDDDLMSTGTGQERMIHSSSRSVKTRPRQIKPVICLPHQATVSSRARITPLLCPIVCVSGIYWTIVGMWTIAAISLQCATGCDAAMVKTQQCWFA